MRKGLSDSSRFIAQDDWCKIRCWSGFGDQDYLGDHDVGTGVGVDVELKDIVEGVFADEFQGDPAAGAGVVVENELFAFEVNAAATVQGVPIVKMDVKGALGAFGAGESYGKRIAGPG